ncbi:hypothetical protein [Embleya sp. NBC_00896]|nr:hypothetical protein OG928_32615 [Embleya sp. NBC_00896]
MTFGQQPQDRGLVLSDHVAEFSAEQGDLGDIERLGRVGPANPAGAR